MLIDILSHEWCEGCKFLTIKENIIHTNIRGREVIRVCEHFNICQNAVDLFKIYQNKIDFPIKGEINDKN